MVPPSATVSVRFLLPPTLESRAQTNLFNSLFVLDPYLDPHFVSRDHFATCFDVSVLNVATLPDGTVDFKATVWMPANVTYTSILSTLIQNIREAQFAPGACKVRGLASMRTLVLAALRCEAE
jgi:hypothetical protein